MRSKASVQVADADRLLMALRRHRPDVSAIAALRAVSGGASQEIWSFDALSPRGAQELILRRTRQWSENGQQGSAGMAAEAALLRAALEVGVPVPEVIGELLPSDGLGDGYLMRRVEGESSARAILRDPELAQARRTLAAECGALMARIHAMPQAKLPALRCGGAAHERRHWEAAHRANGTPRPVFELALRWLAEHEPAYSDPAVLVHGDFRNGNLMVGAEGVRAVLDWELAHLGDPMEDLGWFCVNSWRFGNVALEAGGLGTRAQLFAGYEAESGRRVDEARVHYWQVLGTLKWGITCDAMGLAWRNGSDRSIERLAIARRASEVEVDLLVAMNEIQPVLLSKRADDETSAFESYNPEPLPASAEELAIAISELTLAPTASDEVRTNRDTRIGVSLQSTLAREREMGARLASEEADRIHQILGMQTGLEQLRAALCTAIRNRSSVCDAATLGTHLWATALGQLAIDQPRYRWRHMG
ncbi:phosphotransferase family protein [Variovorax boronicumulans]|uniref:phosphotransferase family protein n=1 Tax=Variovorax boronicumulans TaxID=436515 RepID=UPI0027D7B181|nr:phosphotransferase family protein [Variovorax boronicumulans]